VAAKRRPWRSSRNFSRNLRLSQQKNEEEEEKIRRSQRFSERYYIHYGEGVGKYFAESSLAGLARPSGKGMLEAM